MKNISNLLPNEVKLNERKKLLSERSKKESNKEPQDMKQPRAPNKQPRAPNKQPRAPNKQSRRNKKEELRKWKQLENDNRVAKEEYEKQQRRRRAIAHNYVKKREKEKLMSQPMSDPTSVQPKARIINKTLVDVAKNIQNDNIPKKKPQDDKVKKVYIKELNNNWLIDKDKLNKAFESIMKDRVKNEYENSKKSVTEIMQEINSKKPTTVTWNIKGRTRNKH